MFIDRHDVTLTFFYVNTWDELELKVFILGQQEVLLTEPSPQSPCLYLSIFIKDTVFILNQVSMSAAALGGQQRVLAPRELEVQAVLSPPMSVLGVQVL